MGFLKTEETLNPGDRRLLQVALRIHTAVSFGILLLIYSLLYFFGFHKSGNNSAGVFYWIFVTAITAALLYIYFYQRGKLRKDLTLGIKNVVSGRLTDKQKALKSSGKNSHYSYFLLFDDLSVEVDKTTFIKVQSGNDVRLEIAPRSGKVLSLKTTGNEDNRIKPAGDVKAKTEVVTTISEREAAYLASRRSRNYKRWIRWSIFWFIIFAFVGTMILVPLFVSGTGLTFIYIYSASIIAVLVLFRYLLYRRNIKQLDEDLKEGQKIIVGVLVKEKVRSNVRMTGRRGHTSETGDFYYVVTDENFYEVSADDFHNARENHICSLHISLKSKIVLHIQP